MAILWTSPDGRFVLANANHVTVCSGVPSRVAGISFTRREFDDLLASYERFKGEPDDERWKEKVG